MSQPNKVHAFREIRVTYTDRVDLGAWDGGALRTADDFALYAFRALALAGGRPQRETACVTALDAFGMPCGVRYWSGSVDCVSVSVADVLTTACAAGVSSVHLAHCHPSGDCTPSAADRDLSERIATVCEYAGLMLVDSIVVTHVGTWASCMHGGKRGDVEGYSGASAAFDAIGRRRQPTAAVGWAMALEIDGAAATVDTAASTSQPSAPPAENLPGVLTISARGGARVPGSILAMIEGTGYRFASKGGEVLVWGPGVDILTALKRGIQSAGLGLVAVLDRAAAGAV